MLSDLSTKVKSLKENGAHVSNESQFFLNTKSILFQCGANFIAKELFDTSKCSNLKEPTAAVILDQDRAIVCGEDGLYLLDISKDSKSFYGA
jgi:hypothetical protein